MFSNHNVSMDPDPNMDRGDVDMRVQDVRASATTTTSAVVTTPTAPFAKSGVEAETKSAASRGGAGSDINVGGVAADDDDKRSRGDSIMDATVDVVRQGRLSVESRGASDVDLRDCAR